MAKLGNETKLVLKLAKERIKQKRNEVLGIVGCSPDYKRGYNDAIQDYNNLLLDIQIELER